MFKRPSIIGCIIVSSSSHAPFRYSRSRCNAIGPEKDEEVNKFNVVILLLDFFRGPQPTSHQPSRQEVLQKLGYASAGDIAVLVLENDQGTVPPKL
uniref:Uncharacterized protein n=1 Tax=Romanomermis culicivorax TaxID=13658 RepID=A0A915L0P4_ROMCU